MREKEKINNSKNEMHILSLQRIIIKDSIEELKDIKYQNKILFCTILSF